MNKIILAFVISCLALSSCKIADLRAADIKKGTYGEENVELARTLLDKAAKIHGFDKLNQYMTYEAIATDHYKGMMGKIGNPWGVNKDKIAFRFNVGTFDSRMEVLEGKKKGFVAGLQSWDYYEKENGVIKTNVKDDKAKIFGLAANQYFFELGSRISKAPFVTYIGQDELNGKPVQKVFASWGTERTKDYDHYILWIGKESGRIEATTFTLRDSPLMGSGILTGSMRFEDFREKGGILIPHVQRATMGKPKDNPKKFLHQLVIEKFEWDNFEVAELRPLKGLAVIGDDKPSK